MQCPAKPIFSLKIDFTVDYISIFKLVLGIVAKDLSFVLTYFFGSHKEGSRAYENFFKKRLYDYSSVIIEFISFKFISFMEFNLFLERYRFGLFMTCVLKMMHSFNILYLLFFKVLSSNVIILVAWSNKI